MPILSCCLNFPIKENLLGLSLHRIKTPSRSGFQFNSGCIIDCVAIGPGTMLSPSLKGKLVHTRHITAKTSWTLLPAIGTALISRFVDSSRHTGTLHTCTEENRWVYQRWDGPINAQSVSEHLHYSNSEEKVLNLQPRMTSKTPISSTARQATAVNEEGHHTQCYPSANPDEQHPLLHREQQLKSKE